jgi:hypothetical protein
MAYIHPLAIEHHRKRWLRHDAHRFAKPGTPEAQTGLSHPWAEVARRGQAAADEAKARALAEQDAFEREVLALRHELAKLKLEYELRRFRQKYSPDQPRVPAGNPDGGRWTDGASGAGRVESTDISAQARRGGPPRGTPQQQLRLDLATARAQQALSRVQQLQPDWRPTPSFTSRDTIEGMIRAKEAETRDAEARFIALSRAGQDAPYATHSAQTTAELLRPGGQLIGARDPAVNAPNVRILSSEEFETVRTALMANARRIEPDVRYDGVWYERDDGTRFGLRLSVDHGLTLEVVRGGYYLPDGLRFHQR